jgi:amino acid transporter
VKSLAPSGGKRKVVGGKQKKYTRLNMARQNRVNCFYSSGGMMSHKPAKDRDSELLESMGYSQELLRRMSGFSNFALSFSIICILAGGITSLQLGLSSVGGASIGLGWPLACLFSLLFAMAMGQVASAFPTAGGLYHWGAILGGRGWGWVTAWFNLVGLVTVLSAINVGVWLFGLGCWKSVFGSVPEAFSSLTAQAVGVTLITITQAVLNHLGIRLTTLLTDFSGYLIFAVAIILTFAMVLYASTYDFSRLFTFGNYSGPAGGEVWPASSNTAYLFLLGFLLPAYTITGFDASAHTSEETLNASHNVPRAMVRAVFWSGLFGWFMLCAIVVAIPNFEQAVAQGGNVFFFVMDKVLPPGIKIFLYVGIALAQYLCGLATLTSASRMSYAFARDGGLPFSAQLKKVCETYRTPANAVWAVAAFSLLFTFYTPVYSTITVVSVIFLYISYAIPIGLGFLAHNRRWKTMGPWHIGPWFRPVAALCVLASLVILYAGVQPPNDKALTITAGSFLLTGLVWFGYERKRFKGPPIGRL